MKQIQKISPETASKTVKASMVMVSKKLGRVPNMYQVMANSPAVLDAYVKFNGALSVGTLGSKMTELIALATAESNSCSYCLSAHTYLGSKVGLTETQMLEGRTFQSRDEKMNIGLTFAKKMLETPKEVASKDIEQLRDVGYTDGDILEIVANVTRNIFTNSINIISETEVDWPVIVKPLVTELR